MIEKKKMMKAVALILLSGVLLCSCGNEKSEINAKFSEDPAVHAEELREVIDTVSGEAEVTTFGEWEPDETLLDAVCDATDAITGEGYDIGYMLIDVDTGCGVAFNADQIMCAQGTITAPYVAAMYEAYPESFTDYEDRICDTIKNSDNDAYKFLRGNYLVDCLQEWIVKTGVREEIGEKIYPTYSARECAKLWTEMYRFFATCDNQTLTDYYIDTKFSCVYEELGEEYTVHSKAGWEDGYYENTSEPLADFLDKDPDNDEVATNDCSLVSTPDGDYILVILSDFISDIEPLMPLVRALDNLHIG